MKENARSIQVMKLGDLFDIQSGANVKVAEDNTGYTLRQLRIQDIENGIILASSLEEVPIKEPERLTRQVTQAQDVVISTRGTVTKSAVITEEVAGAVITSNLALLRAKDSSFLKPITLKAFFDSQSGQKALHSMAAGQTILHITTSRLKDLLVPVPSLQAQDDLERLLTNHQRYQQATKISIELSARVTEQLLEKVFTEGKMTA